jgi:hypothetical protein
MFYESQKPYVHFTMSDLRIVPQRAVVTSCYNLGCGVRKPRAVDFLSASSTRLPYPGFPIRIAVAARP